MSLLDLFRGDWTWMALAREVVPILVACAAWFWAGYELGWTKGFYRGAQLDRTLDEMRGKLKL